VERNQANLLQGTLDLLILKAIGDGELQGLALRGMSGPGRFFPLFTAWKKLDG
jgi:hypothetical protein